MSELFVILNTLSVYYSVHGLQDCCVQTGNHTPVSQYSLIYNSVLSVLVVRALKSAVTPSWYYVLLSHASAFAVALFGEISIFSLTLTGGVWERSDLFMRIFVCVVGALLAVGILYKLCTNRSWILPVLVCVGLWAYWWWILVDAGFEYRIHVHHALFYGFVSLIFSGDTRLDIVVHALCIGGVIEGLDFYGVAELSLFMVSDYPAKVYHWWWVPVFSALCFQLIWIRCRREEPEEDDLSYELYRVPLISGV